MVNTGSYGITVSRHFTSALSCSYFSRPCCIILLAGPNHDLQSGLYGSANLRVF